MTVTIRSAQIEDAPELARLAGELGYPSEPAEIRARLAAMLEDRAHQLFVALDGAGVVAGYLHAALRRQLEHDPLVEIVAMVVTEARRSTGVGAALVARAEAWTALHAATQVRVRSNVTRERTHRFYERLGYERHKTSHLFVKAIT